MTLQQPMNLQALCYTTAEDRQALQSLVSGEGVVGVTGGSLLITSSGLGDHSISIAAGEAYILNNDLTDSGMYWVRNNAAATKQIPAGSGGGNNRIDTIIIRIRDAEYAGLDNDAIFDVIAGTPGAAAGASLAAFTPAVLATAGVVPDNSIVLGYVRVLAAGTLTDTILAGNVFDDRTSYVHGGGTRIFKAYRLAAWSTSAPGFADIPFDTVAFNTFPGTTGPGGTRFDTTLAEFTFPEAGLYRVLARAALSAGGANEYISVATRLNGVNISSVTPAATSTSGVYSTQVADILRVTTAGHKLRFQNATPITRTGSVGEYLTWFSVEKIAA